MNKAEAWIGDRMTVRRWLAAVAAVALLAAAVGYWALQPSEPDDAGSGPSTVAGSAGEQRPTKLAITSDVGSVGTLDGLAAVTLSVFPLRPSDNWSVAVRTPAAAAGSTAHELDLPGPDVGKFAKAIDDAVHRHDPEADVTVANAMIHAVETAPGEFRYDVRCVGVLRLNADLMADLKRSLLQAESQRAWLMARTAPLRNPAVPTLAGAALTPDPTLLPTADLARRAK